MIWDCILYNNEKECLQLRCEELKSLEAIHVLVDSVYSFTGKKQKIPFSESDCEDFFCYNIFEYVVNDMHNNGNAWDNEKYQRNKILTALEDLGAQDDDIVIVSDADEIPLLEAVKSYKSEMGIACLLMNMCYYYFNCIHSYHSWRSPKILTYKKLKLSTPNEIRNGGQQTEITNGGWHFSWLGNEINAMNKIKSFSHQEYNIAEITEEFMRHNIENCKHFSNGEQLSITDINEAFPSFLFNNKEKF